MHKLTLNHLLSLFIFFFISFAVHAAPAPTTGVDSSIDKVASTSKVENDRNHSKLTRTAEEISIVFDKNKGAIFRVYSRALRDNPALKGKVVFELVISPAGQVSSVKIVSSEINSPDVEQKLADKIKLFVFESKNVGEMIVSYPVKFLPS